jgi:hypothetical protein
VYVRTPARAIFPTRLASEPISIAKWEHSGPGPRARGHGAGRATSGLWPRDGPGHLGRSARDEQSGPVWRGAVAKVEPRRRLPPVAEPRLVSPEPVCHSCAKPSTSGAGRCHVTWLPRQDAATLTSSVIAQAR